MVKEILLSKGSQSEKVGIVESVTVGKVVSVNL